MIELLHKPWIWFSAAYLFTTVNVFWFSCRRQRLGPIGFLFCLLWPLLGLLSLYYERGK